MSFTKTISTVAALASIFGAGAAGWKLAQDNQQPNVYEERIKQLEEQIEQQPIEKPNTPSPEPVILPPTQPQVLTSAPQPTTLPPVAPPAPPEPKPAGEFE